MTSIITIAYTDGSLEVDGMETTKALREARKEVKWEGTRHVTVVNENGTTLFSEWGDFV